MFLNVLRLRTSPSGHEDEQKVGWLELFYDLVYVATIIALGNRLGEDISGTGVLEFSVLFLPIWWSWAGMTFYVTRFNPDDVGHRLLVFAQMFVISILAISVRDGLGETSQLFALAYAGARLILVLMYLRAGSEYPRMKALTTRYAGGFLLAALIWFSSIFVPAPARFVLWAAGLAVDFGTPLLPGTRRLQAQLPPSVHHLPERFGLFTIIVLGEAFIKVITSASAPDLALSNALHGALALIIAVSLWWMYFDNVKGSVVQRTRFAGQVWVYTHLPLVAAITAFGVSAKKIVLLEHGHALADEKRALIAGALGVALLAIAVLDLTKTERFSELARNRLAWIRAAGAMVILAVGWRGHALNVTGFVGLIAAVCAVQIGADILQYLNAPTAPGGASSAGGAAS